MAQKRPTEGRKEVERKEGRKKGCQYISFLAGLSYTEDSRWINITNTAGSANAEICSALFLSL